MESRSVSARDRIFYAAQEGNRDEVRRLIQSNASVHVSNLTGETPLFVATRKGFKDIVTTLMEAGEESAAFQTSRVNAYGIALDKGDDDLARHIQTYGMGMPRATPDQIVGFVTSGQYKTVENLVREQPEGQNLPLIWEMFLKLDQRLEDPHVQKAFELAVQYSEPGEIDKPQYGRSLLCKAVREDFDPMVSLLLRLGAKAEIPKALSMTTEAPTIKLLLEAYASHPRESAAALSVAELATSHLATAAISLDSVKVLLEYRADVNAIQSDGSTALMLAWSDANVTQLLLENGAADTINVQDDSGNTALMWACFFKATHVVPILLNAKADPSIAKYTGETPLFQACALDKPRVAIIETLCNAGVDVHFRMPGGMTALGALVNGTGEREQAFHVLINAGADIFDETDEGLTTLMLAVGGADDYTGSDTDHDEDGDDMGDVEYDMFGFLNDMLSSLNDDEDEEFHEDPCDLAILDAVIVTAMLRRDL
jgi:ankyrin repeat protein